MAQFQLCLSLVGDPDDSESSFACGNDRRDAGTGTTHSACRAVIHRDAPKPFVTQGMPYPGTERERANDCEHSQHALCERTSAEYWLSQRKINSCCSLV